MWSCARSSSLVVARSKKMATRFSCDAKDSNALRLINSTSASVTESYANLFLPSKHDGDSRHAAIARIGAFEVRLLEMPSVNSPEGASLWVELYDLDLRLGVDSYKCSHLDEAIDAAHLLMIKAKLLNNEAEEAASFSYEGLQENL
jgi:hypothetical protein